MLEVVFAAHVVAYPMYNSPIWVGVSEVPWVVPWFEPVVTAIPNWSRGEAFVIGYSVAIMAALIIVGLAPVMLEKVTVIFFVPAVVRFA